MIEDLDRCYAAMASRDSRFDGWFVMGVRTTGIYCRPSCPAVTPKREHVCAYVTAAAAHTAGFRACLRCRPDAAPGSPEWDLRADLVGRAMRQIADGVVDRDGVDGLATRLGYSARHLHRVLSDEVGAGPIALARAQRTRTARILIETTTLSMSEVAFAAGFASVRQFNDTVRALAGRTPTELRRRARGGRSQPDAPITVRLAARQPIDLAALWAHLGRHSIPGVTNVDADGTYRRTLHLPRGGAVLAVTHDGAHLIARITCDDLRDLTAAVARCRRLLDLDADPVAVDAHLGIDPALAPHVATHPGLRVPGAVDGGEAALLAVLGQQVSTRAATTLAGRLVARCGMPLASPTGPLTHRFPTPAAVAEADLDALGMPRRRAAALRAVAVALTDGRVGLDAGAERAAARRELLAIDGIGTWTADVIALRALADPDASCPGDLAVRRGAAALGLPSTTPDLSNHATRWAPWRAYATQHLIEASLDAPPATATTRSAS